MQLVFLYGQVASGKLTVARALAERTGFALFHNHLIVDAVAAVFPFGSSEFVRLREQFWLETIEAAAANSTSLIFTFAPEPTVTPDFPERVSKIVEQVSGRITFVALTVPPEVQSQRLVAASRAEFGKLRSLEILHQLRDDFTASMRAMPAADLTIDTASTTPDEAAARIAGLLA